MSDSKSRGQMKLAMPTVCVVGSESGTVSTAVPGACIHRACSPMGCITPRCGHVAGSNGPSCSSAHSCWRRSKVRAQTEHSCVRPNSQHFGVRLESACPPLSISIHSIECGCQDDNEREGRGPVARRKKFGDAMTIYRVRPGCTPESCVIGRR